jgi:membrane associated rhomboid family serine protease
MLIPYSVDVPMIRYPFANWVLMAVIALVSIGAWIAPSRSSDQLRFVEDEQGVVHVVGDMQEPTPPLALKPRAFAVWQLVSHIFAHGDIFHLAGNLVFLFVFGNAIDAKLGHLWFSLSFFFFGISAGLAWLIFGNGLPMIGSSGAIMGVTGVFLILYPRNDVVVFFWLWPLPWYIFRVSSWILIVIYLPGQERRRCLRRPPRRRGGRHYAGCRIASPGLDRIRILRRESLADVRLDGDDAAAWPEEAALTE